MRKEIFFLRSNDELFKPEIDSKGKNINIQLAPFSNQFIAPYEKTIIDVPLGTKKGYFVIAVPST